MVGVRRGRTGDKLPVALVSKALTHASQESIFEDTALQCSEVTGPVGADFGTSICGERPQTHVPSTAASGIAQPCRLDGCSHTCRLRAPIQVRCKTRKANEHSRYQRVMRLANQRRLSRRTDEVDEMSGALRLPAATHRGLTSGVLAKGGCTSLAACCSLASALARCVSLAGCVSWA